MKGQRFFPLVVVAAGLLAYHNSFTGPFVRDDAASIPGNPTIRRLWPIWQPLSPPHGNGVTVEGRPILNLSLAINYALGGYNVWGYHALNLTIHILAGLTLLGIVRRTLLQPRLRERFGAAAEELALAVAVLWTVHPLQTESVTYVIQRAESLMGLLYLSTLYCFIRGAESPRASLWYSLSVTACALGMACKEVMVSAPLMVMLYDRTFLSGSFQAAWRRRWPVCLVLVSTWILLGFVVIPGQLRITSTKAQLIGLTWWQYLATEPGVILHYLRLSVWPYPLCLDYAWPIARSWTSILPPTVVIVLLLGASAWAGRANSVWGFVGAWFFLILAPSSSCIPLESPAFEHRLYLPLAAMLTLGVVGLYSLVGRRSAAVFVAVAIGFGFLTARRNEDYRSELAIWADTAAKRPKNPRAQYCLGEALSHEGRVQEAIASYERALRLQPDYAEAHNNLGIALAQAGRVDEAIENFEQALRINPRYVEAHNNLGTVLLQAGRIQEAIEYCEQALRIDPNSAEAHNNLGNALSEIGDTKGAIWHYEQAVRVNPDLAVVRYNLGNVLFQAGKIEDATRQYAEALRINPQYAEAHNNLAIALSRMGRTQEAIGHWEQALRINPGYTEAQNNLAALQSLPQTPGPQK